MKNPALPPSLPTSTLTSTALPCPPAAHCVKDEGSLCDLYNNLYYDIIIYSYRSLLTYSPPLRLPASQPSVYRYRFSKKCKTQNVPCQLCLPWNNFPFFPLPPLRFQCRTLFWQTQGASMPVSRTTCFSFFLFDK